MNHPETKRTLEVYSDQPGVQFYTANFIPQDPTEVKGVLSMLAERRNRIHFSLFLGYHEIGDCNREEGELLQARGVLFGDAELSGCGESCRG